MVWIVSAGKMRRERLKDLEVKGQSPGVNSSQRSGIEIFAKGWQATEWRQTRGKFLFSLLIEKIFWVVFSWVVSGNGEEHMNEGLLSHCWCTRPWSGIYVPPPVGSHWVAQLASFHRVLQNMVFGNLLSTKSFYNFLQGVTLSKRKRASFPLAR